MPLYEPTGQIVTDALMKLQTSLEESNGSMNRLTWAMAWLAVAQVALAVVQVLVAFRIIGR
jgi:hypothetical protein